MGFWLSHVPRERLGEFLALARRWLKPGGRFAFIDSLPDPASGAADHPEPADDLAVAPAGRRPRVHDRQGLLHARRVGRGARREPASTDVEVTTTGRFFVLGLGSRRPDRGSTPRTRETFGERRTAPVAILRPMSPLANATIATVGSGVMAEAMIAGLLRGALVEPERVVASHPRAERREALEREYGIRTVADNLEAVRDADVILLGIKPQMLNKVGREIGPHLRRGQLVLSVLAGATTAALTGILGHDQVVRSMPNTPARLGKGVTVWYATPETTETQRAQAAALLGALGLQLEVDDEKMVAMATAVSGTGPTYVFLVMEALIDAAVHLGFPRHVAHDLVIETLEGSTLFAKQSGMHPAELRNMVTTPGGTSAAALHELESGRLRTVLSEAVWAAFRRTVELGDQLEASLDVPAKDGPAASMTAPTDHGRRSTCAARRSPTCAPSTSVPPERDLWADEAALWDRLARDVGRPGRRRLAPARRRAVGRRRTRLVARRAHRPRRRLAGAGDRLHPGGASARALAVGRRLRRRRLRPLQRAPPGAVDDDAGRGHRGAADRRPAAPAGRGAAALARRRSAATRRGAGCTSSCTATISTTSPSSSRGPIRSGSARSMATRSSPIRGRPTIAGFRAQEAAIEAQFDALVRTVPAPRWTTRT